MLTHYGLSGPLALTLSSLLPEDSAGVRLRVDLKPALDEQALDARLLRDFAQAPRKELISALDGLAPHSLALVIAELSGLSPRSPSSITQAERRVLVGVVKGMALTVKALRGFAEAVVTQGGGRPAGQPVDDAVPAGRGPFLRRRAAGRGRADRRLQPQIAFSTGALAGKSAAALSARPSVDCRHDPARAKARPRRRLSASGQAIRRRAIARPLAAIVGAIRQRTIARPSGDYRYPGGQSGGGQSATPAAIVGAIRRGQSAALAAVVGTIRRRASAAPAAIVGEIRRAKARPRRRLSASGQAIRRAIARPQRRLSASGQAIRRRQSAAPAAVADIRAGDPAASNNAAPAAIVGAIRRGQSAAPAAIVGEIRRRKSAAPAAIVGEIRRRQSAAPATIVGIGQAIRRGQSAPPAAVVGIRAGRSGGEQNAAPAAIVGAIREGKARPRRRLWARSGEGKARPRRRLWARSGEGSAAPAAIVRRDPARAIARPQRRLSVSNWAIRRRAAARPWRRLWAKIRRAKRGPGGDCRPRTGDPAAGKARGLGGDCRHPGRRSGEGKARPQRRLSARSGEGKARPSGDCRRDPAKAMRAQRRLSARSGDKQCATPAAVVGEGDPAAGKAQPWRRLSASGQAIRRRQSAAQRRLSASGRRSGGEQSARP